MTGLGAMIVMAGLCGAGALVTALLVADDRMPAPRIMPHPRTHACALPTTD